MDHRVPTKVVSEIGGKVLQQGVRSGNTAMGVPYAFAFVQLLDKALGEIVEVTHNVTDGSTSPFADLQRGQFVKFPVGVMRTYGGMLTGSLVVDVDDAGEADAT